MVNFTDSIAECGFAIIPGVLKAADLAEQMAAVEMIGSTDESTRNGSVGGVRNLFEISPVVRALAQSRVIRALVLPILGDGCVAVRAILFDKTPGANWKVPWHQDLTIAVRERRDVDGFGPWSVKAGIDHVQAPVAVLANMVSARIHLDPCGAENGPLRVLPGSHLAGRLDADKLQDWRVGHEARVCTVEAGGVLLMRPLLLHASSAAISPAHRRVIHIDYAAGPLPDGLHWDCAYGRQTGR